MNSPRQSAVAIAASATDDEAALLDNLTINAPEAAKARWKPAKRRAIVYSVIVLLLFCSIAAISLPPRPAPRETWIISSDGRTASVTGRASQPLWKKLNPVWWFLNDDEPDPPDWQLPGKPFIIRQLSWYLRNPLQNFGKYVLGVADRNYTVVGTAPVYAAIWSDVDSVKTGWKVSMIRINGLDLPFVSYENEYLIWYAGWQWSGFLGFKFNFKKSPIQIW